MLVSVFVCAGRGLGIGSISVILHNWAPAAAGHTKEVMRAGDCEASLHLRASSGGQARIN